MSKLTFGEFRKANVERCLTSFHDIKDWDAADWLGAITGELGEAANVLKERRRRRPSYQATVDEHGHVIVMGPGVGMRPVETGFTPPLTDDERQRLAYELADVVTYTDLLAEWAGIDLGEAMREKFNAVSERVNSKVKL
jgi:NTP pyrophosphatase (non-canonical NTP hydrolase)